MVMTICFVTSPSFLLMKFVSDGQNLKALIIKYRPKINPLEKNRK